MDCCCSNVTTACCLGVMSQLFVPGVLLRLGSRLQWVLRRPMAEAALGRGRSVGVHLGVCSWAVCVGFWFRDTLRSLLHWNSCSFTTNCIYLFCYYFYVYSLLVSYSIAFFALLLVRPKSINLLLLLLPQYQVQNILKYQLHFADRKIPTVLSAKCWKVPSAFCNETDPTTQVLTGICADFTQPPLPWIKL